MRFGCGLIDSWWFVCYVGDLVGFALVWWGWRCMALVFVLLCCGFYPGLLFVFSLVWLRLGGLVVVL